MLELLRKYVDSLTGITEIPRERAEKLVADLQSRGELRAKDLQKAAEDLVARSRRNRQELVGLVRKEIQRQVSALGLMTKADVDRLDRRVKKLEGAGQQKKKSPAKRKTSSRKTTRPASRKTAPRSGSTS